MKYGLIGERLGHSFSEDIHRLLGHDSYELREVPKEALSAFLHDREFSGINVTVPYKEAVIPHLDYIDPIAQRSGAVNTIVNHDGKLCGYNTDYHGLRMLLEHSQLSLKDKKILILGSGGTSKTALAVAEDMGCTCALRVSRSQKTDCVTYAQAVCEHQDAHVLINATPCGMYPDTEGSPIELFNFPNLQAVVDVVYNPLRTRLVCEAQARGLVAIPGLYMLVAQAVHASQLFTGKTLHLQAADDIYRRLMEQKENIVLIGMPGCGKTTVGKQLAQLLGRSFYDTDQMIEEREGAIATLFSAKGESYFRSVESAVIQELSQKHGCVIATGGGAVLSTANRLRLRKNGRIVFLDRALEQLEISTNRPLSADLESLSRLYEERCVLYPAVCDAHVDANGDIDTVVRRCREVIEYETPSLCHY